MTRAEVTVEVLAAMRGESLTFTELAERAGTDRVWLTAALLGQHPIPSHPTSPGAWGRRCRSQRRPSVILQEIPTRGSFQALPPTDPTIYRLYEVLQVYGPRVRIILDGKWLPYQWQP